MSRMMCIPCNVEFPSEPFYVVHKKSGHIDMNKAVYLEELPVPTPPPGIPQDAMPSPEFMETVARIESPKPSTEESVASQHPSELPKAQPIILTYKYLGECPEHRTSVDTLELDVAKEHFAIAYCSSGKHQVETRGAVKL